MLKNIISYIFIYIFVIGCEHNPFIETEDVEECSYCFLELTSDLPMDENGNYHLKFNENHSQTFTRVNAYVGHAWEYVGWMSDTEYCFDWNGTQQCYDVINGSSYSGEDGIASTIMGIHEIHIGDTIKVYCGYTDNYDTQYSNSLEVIIDE